MHEGEGCRNATGPFFISISETGLIPTIMSHPGFRFALISSLLLSAFANGMLAANKIDLERLKPVADTEVIPIADFFVRPCCRNPS